MKQADVVGALYYLHAHSISEASPFDISKAIQSLDGTRFLPSASRVLGALDRLVLDGTVIREEKTDELDRRYWTYRLETYGRLCAEVERLAAALDYAIDIIQSYEADIRAAVDDQSLAERGICQGAVYRDAVQRIRHLAEGKK